MEYGKRYKKEFPNENKKESKKENKMQGESEMNKELISAVKKEELQKKGYICRALLGKGAFSQVYRVEGRDGRIYACKISGNARMLEKEARIMEKLEHPLFPEFHVFWRQGEWGFLIMEAVAGSSLEAMLERRGGFSPAQVVRTGIELAEGLLYLHERTEKYLFRDVKPANIMIRQDGRIKLLDLGCVCSMRERSDFRAGTPGYAAPEQLEEGRLAESCDVYGLGRTLEIMLGCRNETLKASFRKKGERKTARELNRILEVCSRQNAQERISDMRDVMHMFMALEKSEDCTWKQEAVCRKNIWESMHKKI